MSLTIDELSPKFMLSKEDIACHPCQKRSYWCWPPLRHCFRTGSGSMPRCCSWGRCWRPGARTVTAALRVMGLAAERHFTNYHRVLNRATWSARQGSRILFGLLDHAAGAPRGDDRAGSRRHGGTPQSGGKITAKGCYRDAVRSTKKHVIRCFGLKWVVDDALGAGALEPAGVGVALSDRAVLAGEEARPATGIRPAWIGCGR